MKWWEDLQLKGLQRTWYLKLKDSGFCDIENTESPREYLNVWESSHFYKSYTPDQFAERASYYRRAGKFLHEYGFKNRTQKKIWQLHSEGLAIHKIAKQLNMPAAGSKKSVHSILKELKLVMRSWEFDVE